MHAYLMEATRSGDSIESTWKITGPNAESDVLAQLVALVPGLDRSEISITKPGHTDVLVARYRREA